MTRHVLVVADAAAGRRLDAFVAESGLGISRSQVRHLVDAGSVTIGGRARKAGQLVRAGEEVVVDVPAAAPPVAEPEALPLRVLYEDEAIAVIDKAPGMVVHPAPGRWQGTLVNALLHRWGPMPDHEATRPGIVHRLDRDTSGVMVVARTVSALDHLAKQFAARTVEKRYLAVARGRVRSDVLRIDAPIGRHAVERKKMSTRARVARPAVTRIRVLERFAGATLVEAAPETGRTHQIRVHLASRGHPVVGDAVYGRARAGATTLIARQALHASSLGFVHPVRGAAMTFRAELWPDMVALLEALRAQRDRQSPG
ncbi:MAG: RluA family pseudouridine synthase [Deltaproteobacteria bacterium]|nr:RluA family pseudouridine synthase [Deltaproteobacteria bacterium]